MLELEDICEIYQRHKDAWNAQVEEFQLGHKQFSFNTDLSAILGIVNLSTDSWYKDSICYTVDQAVRRARIATAQGAQVIDIGAESTVPTTARVDVAQQHGKLLPVLKILSQEGILTSVETYYPEVARKCLQAGANVINYTGIEHLEEIYRIVAEFDAGLIVCYLQGNNSRELIDLQLGEDPIAFVYERIAQEVEQAIRFGVRKLFIDPGIGFSYANLHKKPQLRLRYQMQFLLSSFRLKQLGFPICIALPTALEYFAEEFRSSQVFTAVLAILGQAHLLRTHEVAKVKAVLDVMNLF